MTTKISLSISTIPQSTEASKSSKSFGSSATSPQPASGQLSGPLAALQKIGQVVSGAGGSFKLSVKMTDVKTRDVSPTASKMPVGLPSDETAAQRAATYAKLNGKGPVSPSPEAVQEAHHAVARVKLNGQLSPSRFSKGVKEAHRAAAYAKLDNLVPTSPSPEDVEAGHLAVAGAIRAGFGRRLKPSSPPAGIESRWSEDSADSNTDSRIDSQTRPNFISPPPGLENRWSIDSADSHIE